VNVIHFTQGATDPLYTVESLVCTVALADAPPDLHLSCMHLLDGAQIDMPPRGTECVLLSAYGKWTLRCRETETCLTLSGGVGAVLQVGEEYSIGSEEGAVILILECSGLKANRAGISSPARIIGQRWPGDS
jgi:hypothetical protein